MEIKTSGKITSIYMTELNKKWGGQVDNYNFKGEFAKKKWIPLQALKQSQEKIDELEEVNNTMDNYFKMVSKENVEFKSKIAELEKEKKGLKDSLDKECGW